ncbi:50S ribosomal protein L23 [Candidatus Saccharibacteria bacterium]|nr:50S ribosomal protein L23 [Candidatus Saccharibacteria bacterium]
MAKDDKTNIKLHLIEPRATEKSYLEQTNRIYVFPVKRSASKQAIAKMIEKDYEVTVTDVRTLIRKGKQTKFSRGKHAYPGITYRRGKKFAYVRLKKGDSIKVFDEPEDDKKTSAKEAKKAEKTAKKVDKNAGKENK